MSLLRFSTAGSVDDGKSTLIGRLLYDSKGVYEDQLASVAKASATVASNNGFIDLALLTDGLRAEREQGITIDVAYRYFSTPQRKFIIADTPGHEQYTRNMATGASNADLAIILIDARHGVLPQSRRHAFIANLLGIRHLVVAVNKMDLVGFGQQVFDDIRDEFRQFLHQIGAPEALFIPISARDGDNVVTRSTRAPWYMGPALLEHLETVSVEDRYDRLPARFPVQYVLRPDLNFRGYAGQIASGVFHQGDSVVALPSRRSSQITRIVTYEGDLPEAHSPQSVTLCLADEIDISRGEMIVPEEQVPHVGRRFHADIVWMNSKALEPGQSYLLKHTSRQVRAVIRAIEYRVDVNSLEHQQSGKLQLNEIGRVSVSTHHPLFFDEYKTNRFTGSFILIDHLTNATCGAGMITGIEGSEETRGEVTEAERTARFGHRAATLLVEDHETALVLERELFDRGANALVLAQPYSALAAALKTSGVIGILTDASAEEAMDVRGMEISDVIAILESSGVLSAGSR